MGLLLEDMEQDLFSMNTKQESLFRINQTVDKGTSVLGLFACKRPLNENDLFKSPLLTTLLLDFYAPKDVSEHGEGGEVSLDEFARQVKNMTPETLIVVEIAERQRLEERVTTLYNRGHESSVAYLESSKWLEQANNTVSTMENVLDDVAQKVEVLRAIINNADCLNDNAPPHEMQIDK